MATVADAEFDDWLGMADHIEAHGEKSESVRLRMVISGQPGKMLKIGTRLLPEPRPLDVI